MSGRRTAEILEHLKSLVFTESYEVDTAMNTMWGAHGYSEGGPVMRDALTSDA